MGTFENTIAIFNYRQFKNILEKNGQTFSTKAKAFASGKLIYDGKVEYSISCDNGRDWSEISIFWNMPEISNQPTRTSFFSFWFRARTSGEK